MVLSSKIKIRKVAPPQAAKRTSSPCSHCSRATFRQSQKQTHAIMDRSSLTSALISAHPLVTSDAGSSDRRTNDLGATFLSVSILYHIAHLFSRSIWPIQVKFTSRSWPAVWSPLSDRYLIRISFVKRIARLIRFSPLPQKENGQPTGRPIWSVYQNLCQKSILSISNIWLSFLWNIPSWKSRDGLLL